LHVSNTIAGYTTEETFKYNTFYMEWIPPTALPRGLAHLPVKNKADLGKLRVEVDKLLSSAMINVIASTSSQ